MFQSKYLGTYLTQEFSDLYLFFYPHTLTFSYDIIPISKTVVTCILLLPFVFSLTSSLSAGNSHCHANLDIHLI